MDINRVIVMGRLTRDPETRHTQNGKSVCHFTVANGRKYKAGDEWKEQTSFLNCIAWDKLGENIQKFFTKGQKILVTGRVQQSSYEDKEGKKVSKVEIVLDDFSFCDSKKKDGGAGESDELEKLLEGEEPPF